MGCVLGRRFLFSQRRGEERRENLRFAETGATFVRAAFGNTNSCPSESEDGAMRIEIWCFLRSDLCTGPRTFWK